MTVPPSFDVARLRGLVRLAGPTSHDIRGTCGTMAVHLELLATALDELPEPLSDRLSGYVAVLRREAMELLTAAEAFLSLVAPAGAPSEFDLAALLHETTQALRPLVTQRRLVLDVARPSLPVPATAVRESVRQDILEVVVPILDELPPGSRVSLALTSAASGGTLTVGRPDAGPLVVPLPRRAEAEA